MKSWKKKMMSVCLAGAVGFGVNYMVMPERQASASILGAVIKGAQHSAEVEKQIDYYDNSEEGREALFMALQQQCGVCDDAELNDRLAGIMENLSAAVAKVDPSINDKPYNYFVNQDKSFNAFCAMGHNMSVNVGLFDTIQSDDEVAAVLAHEMGHGQKNHVAKGMRSEILTKLAGDLAGRNVGTVLLENAVNRQVFSKSMETEADALSFEYLTNSPYNPGACAAIWQRVIERYGNNAENFASFIATGGGSDHDSNALRRNTMAEKLEKFSGKHVKVANGEVFVNGKSFVKPAAVGDMSGEERSYFVAGNLARAFHDGQDKAGASVRDGVVCLGEQNIMTAVDGDEAAETLAERLNAVK